MSITVCYRGKKVTTRPRPSTTLGSVLKSICAKHSLPVEQCSLRYNGKPVDLSIPFRLSSLPAGASVDLVREVRSKVSRVARVAIQCPSGRFQGRFNTSETIWRVLEELERHHASSGLVLTRNERDGAYLIPRTTYLSTRVDTLSALATTSLGALGVKDSALLRVDFHPSKHALSSISTLIEEAVHAAEAANAATKMAAANHEQQSPKRPRPNATTHTSTAEQGEKAANSMDVAPVDSSHHSTSSSDALHTHPMPTEDPPAVHPSASTEDIDSPMDLVKPEESIGTSDGGGGGVAHASSNDTSNPTADTPSPTAKTLYLPEDRHARVFKPGAAPIDTSKLEEDVSDDDLQLTAEDVAIATASMRKRKQQEEADAILMTREMREKRRMESLARYTKTIIRVRFPNRLELQGFFHPDETIDHVMEFVRDHLKWKEERFYLFTTPPPERIRDTEKTLRWLSFCPAAIFHFSWENKDASPKEYLCDHLMVEDHSSAKDDAIDISSFRALRVKEQDSHPPIGHVLGHTPSPSTADAAPDADAPRDQTTNGVGGKKKSVGGKRSAPPKWLKLGK